MRVGYGVQVRTGAASCAGPVRISTLRSLAATVAETKSFWRLLCSSGIMRRAGAIPDRGSGCFPVAPLEVVWIALLGTVSGLLIGCIGIGGVILVPALVFIVGIPIQVAIPAAMLSYIVSSVVATFVYAHNNSIAWPMSTWLCIGGAPAAFAGAWAVSIFDSRLLAGCLGLLTLLSGINSLRRQNISGVEVNADAKVSNAVLLIIGLVTGFLSSLTGTGGPLVLVPILISTRLAILTSVGLSQVFQLPVALAATAGNIVYGKLDLTLGAILAASLSGGSWYGAKLAHSLPRAVLRGVVSMALILIGAFILGNVGWHLMK
jgi:uncharacterized membrane protein YfcA